MIGALLTIPFNVWIENIAVVWGILGDKNGFYVVKKDTKLKSGSEIDETEDCSLLRNAEISPC